MKQGIHPEFQEVVFMDSATGAKFLAGSTLKSDETVEFEGETYPLIRVEVSSDSHPFYTGKQKFAQADGRIDDEIQNCKSGRSRSKRGVSRGNFRTRFRRGSGRRECGKRRRKQVRRKISLSLTEGEFIINEGKT